MAIREALVASAAQFLQEASVAQSPVENRIAFLRQKNLTQEEIDAALARANSTSLVAQSQPTTPSAQAAASAPAPAPAAAPAQQAYASQPQSQYAQYQQYPQQPPPVPARDWRDWFIMATVMGGVGYGLYALGKRYVYPLIAPPTPSQLEEDKAHLDAQFDRAFTLVEQLANDTEKLKAAEQERTEKLDAALAELDSVITEMKTSSRDRQDKMRDLREEVRVLTNKIPNLVDEQKNATDTRLKEINAELLSLKTLITRVTSTPAPAPAPAAPVSTAPVSTPGLAVPSVPSPPAATPAAASPEITTEVSATGSAPRTSPFGNAASGGKATIPAWQLAAEGS